MSPMLIFIIGVIVGVIGTGYATVEPFRSRINSAIGGAVNGVLSGKQGRKSKSPTEATKAEKAVKKKQHTCMRCGQSGTIDDMDEVSLKDSRATAWIHTHCLNDLPQNGE